MYSLEQVDDENQRRQAAMGNVSASNDPQQQVHDSNEQLIKGAEVLGAGRTLGLTDDETLTVKSQTQQRDSAREAQRARARRRISDTENTLYLNDDVIQGIDQKEREFQKDVPQRAMSLDSLEYGGDEADLQADIAGEGDRRRRRLQQQAKDKGNYEINMAVERPGGRPERIEASIAPGQPIPEDLKEAAILQEMNLRFPERNKPQYVEPKFKGQPRRRSFGTYERDSGGNLVKTVKQTVSSPRASGQLLDPSTVISTDKYPTPVFSGYRGIADDGPTEIQRPVMAPANAGNDAYARLVDAVNSGQVKLTDTIQSPATSFVKNTDGSNKYPEQSTTMTVGQLLDRMSESQNPGVAAQMTRDNATQVAISDMRLRKQQARRTLREVAIQAKAEGNPLSKSEAMSLLARLENAGEDSKTKAGREAAGYVGSYGNTDEIIGETTMSDEAWKAKAGKTIGPQQVAPEPAIYAGELGISSERAQPIMSMNGEVIGYGAGGEILGEINAPSTDQVLNAPSQKDQNLVDFITQKMAQPDTGGVSDVIITDATNALTDRARGLSPKGFGDDLVNVPQGVRSLSEAQSLMDNLIARGMNRGAAFSRPNPEGGAPIRVPAGETPTYLDLMSTMRMDPSEQGNLANALYQMALAENRDVNQEGKARYAAREGSYATPGKDANMLFDSPAGFFYDGVQPATITNSQRARVGPDGKNVNIQPLLRQLPDSDAAAPFIGAVRGEEPVSIAGDPNNPNYRYRKGFGEGVSVEEGYSNLEKSMAKGKRRYSQKRVDNMVGIAKEVERRQAAGEEDAAVKRVMDEAATVAFGDQQRKLDGEIYQSQLRNQRLIREKLAGGNSLNVNRSAPTPAVVPQSIAPQPGAGTGNQATPAIDAGRGGWMGGSDSGRVVSPWSKPSGALASLRQPAKSTEQPSRYYDGSNQYDVASAFSDERSRRQGASTSAGIPREQGPAMRTEPRTRQQRVDAFTNFGRKNKRALGISAAGAGTAAILAGILGTGGEEEEQY